MLALAQPPLHSLLVLVFFVQSKDRIYLLLQKDLDEFSARAFWVDRLQFKTTPTALLQRVSQKWESCYLHTMKGNSACSPCSLLGDYRQAWHESLHAHGETS